MVCISNCDKITPGMLMAALRLNIPVVFVSGGPMEAGKAKLAKPTKAMESRSWTGRRHGHGRRHHRSDDADVAEVERSRLPNLRLAARACSPPTR